MKAFYLFIAIFFFLSPLAVAADDTDLSDQVRDQIETQAREMQAMGVPAEAARNMLTMMHRNRFQAETIASARQEVANCAHEGLPAEPLISKAMEGMAKQAGEQQIVMAMQAVHRRYAYANRLAQPLGSDKKTTDTLTNTIADSLSAEMRPADLEAIMAQLQARTRQQTKNQAEALALQTFQTVRTMARLGIRSADVSEIIRQGLQNQYTPQQMRQLRQHITTRDGQASPHQSSGQFSGSSGKGGQGGHSGGSAGGRGGR